MSASPCVRKPCRQIEQYWCLQLAVYAPMLLSPHERRAPICLWLLAIHFQSKGEAVG
jgi:hypothetical protein